MRLLLILDRLRDRGGSGIYVEGLHKALLSQGVTCFFAYGRKGEFAGVEKPMPDNMRRIHNLDGKHSGPWDRKVISRLERLIESTDSAGIVVQNIMNPAVLEFLSAMDRAVLVVQDHRIFCPARGKVFPDGRPCRIEMGEACAQCFEEKARFEEMLKRTRERLSAALEFRKVVVLSDYMKQELQIVGFDASKVFVIPPAPLLNGEPRKSGRTGIAVSGRIAWQKGCTQLLDAMTRGGITCKVSFIGDGPLRKRLERKASDLGLSGQVTVEGWVEHDELSDCLTRAVCLVMPSLWAEPFGLAGLEAAALSVPVVAFDVGGVGQWLEHGKTGILVKPQDFEGLMTAVKSLLKDEKQADALGESAARLIAQRFSPALLSSRWMGLLKPRLI